MSRKISLFFIILVVIVTGCGGISEKEMKTEAERMAGESFEGKAREPNEKIESGSFFLPEEYTVSSKKPNNAVLKKGEQKFLLFINNNEKGDSKESYKTLQSSDEELTINKTFENKEKFGYLLVYKTNEEKYEVTAGIGGNKVSTIAEKEAVPESAKEMMKMLKSVQ
ncbi:hypothetical protein ACQCVE_07470 [Metabacillus sp. 113a]|uniref:hypothetical protein n=1 Tax=Metabacillus sp. 113a TaxID=3404706 RepID=UPI003CF4A1CF